ncbi:MAG TPA: lipid-A-disaccharide synthase [Desulfobacterales bacterium]|nr:lipid-A-disaccharide synthase [Desulfobacterales bacterium]
MDRFSEEKCIMIIAGETSGDIHGAKLVSAIRKRNNGLFFCGIGGRALGEAGVKLLMDASEIAVVGITEVFSKIPNILKGLRVAKKALKTLHPDLLILIDFPDFNLHLASSAKKLGIPVLYYISPQIWAWRPGRVKRIGELVDHLAVILPFEEDFYRGHKIPVTFVGHPLLDNHASPQNKTLNRHTKDNPVIGFLPGSRDGEIARHLPIMINSARILHRKIENVKFLISLAPEVKRTYIEGIIKKSKTAFAFELVADRSEKVFERSNLVVAASGTVTLEAAISGTPMVIIYKVSPISYWVGRAMIQVKHIGLVNLIAGRKIVPELLQKAASPTRISDTVLEMLRDPSDLERIRLELLNIRDLLGGPGASERVADIAWGMMQF